MGVWYRFFWIPIKWVAARWSWLLAAVLLIGLIIGVGTASLFASLAPSWTGFAADPLPPNAPATAVVIYEQEKTLWDWLSLLLVPLVLAIGGFFLTRSENRYALKLQQERDQKANQREAERAQDATLQAYLDQMTQLLLEKELRASKEDDEVRSVARARTLTALRVLDKERKGTIIQFLYEAALIGKSTIETDRSVKYIDAVVGLSGAVLDGVS